MIGKPDEVKQETKQDPSQEVQKRPYGSEAVGVVAAHSRRLRRLLEDMAQARTVLEYKEWLGDRPAALARELERHATLAVALQEAAAHRADGKADEGLDRLRTVVTLPGELDESWLWLLEPEQRALKDNYTALLRGLIVGLRKQVGEILDSRATAVEQLQGILEAVEDSFAARAVREAIQAEVSARVDEAVERRSWREAQELLKIIRETAIPWAPQRQRGRLGNLVRPSSPGKPRRQQLSGTDQQPASHPARPIGRPPRRTEKGERPSSPVVSDALMPSAEDQPEQGKEP